MPHGQPGGNGALESDQTEHHRELATIPMLQWEAQGGTDGRNLVRDDISFLNSHLDDPGTTVVL